MCKKLLVVVTVTLALVLVACGGSPGDQDAIREAAEAFLTVGAATEEANTIATRIAGLDAQVSGATVEGELLEDKCSAAVYVTPVYPGPDQPSFSDRGILLVRDPANPNAAMPWSRKIPIDGHVFFRWYCNSTTGNFLDPGTWTVSGAVLVAGSCTQEASGAFDCGIGPSVDSVSITLPEGWTAERARCESENTTAISARLGPDRLLEFQCWEDQ